MINSEGEIVPCYRLSHDYEEFVFGRKKSICRHSFGNVREKYILDVWQSGVYEDFRNIIYNNRYPSCIDCDYVDGCDLVKDSTIDCYTTSPSCADCLWSRKFIICP